MNDALVDSLDVDGEVRGNDREEPLMEAGRHTVVARRMLSAAPVRMKLRDEFLVTQTEGRHDPPHLLGCRRNAFALSRMADTEDGGHDDFVGGGYPAEVHEALGTAPSITPAAD